jgi:hypothetical protein
MTIYRAQEPMSVWVESLGREVHIKSRQELDDQFPEDAAVIKEWAHRGLVREVNPVESATAAPGEARSTRRK